ncbi:hypothetical protein PM082_021153 [Marasmius tenuissimus]|nr:hypothetical protein PM082_021153 [Marasmius tenuissimus]
MTVYPESLLGRISRPPEKFRHFRHPISDSDRREVKNYLSDIEGAYNKCQLEINKYKALILMLESRKEGMKSVMEKFRSLLSPAHQLPLEVLLEVFGHYCELNDLSERTMPPTLILSMVCGRWREVVLSSSRLWSSIAVTMCLRNGDRLLRTESTVTWLTRLFLERSRAAPLEIILKFPYLSEGNYTNKAVMNLLEENSERWKELEIFGCEFYASPRAGNINLPTLRHLALHREGGDIQNPDLSRLSTCPALTSVRMDVLDLEGHLQLPWANIRDLTLAAYTGASALTAIELCTSLEQLTLFDINSVQESSQGLMISSNTIRNLTMQGPDSDLSLLRHFIFPRLSSIDFKSVYIDELPVDPLDPYIQRFFLPVTVLRLDSVVSLTDCHLISFLRLMPELRTLVISEPENTPTPIVTNPFLTHLTVKPDDFRDPPFLPRLTELKLECFADQFDEHALSNVLTSRWLPVPSVASAVGVDCLRSVDITIVHRGDAVRTSDVLPSLQCLKDIGMRLRLATR